eukprot:UN30269
MIKIHEQNNDTKEILRLFDKMKLNNNILAKPDIITYNSVIHSLDKKRHKVALDCYYQMVGQNLKPNLQTFDNLLNTCNNHSEITNVLNMMNSHKNLRKI